MPCRLRGGLDAIETLRQGRLLAHNCDSVLLSRRAPVSERFVSEVLGEVCLFLWLVVSLIIETAIETTVSCCNPMTIFRFIIMMGGLFFIILSKLVIVRLSSEEVKRDRERVAAAPARPRHREHGPRSTVAGGDGRESRDCFETEEQDQEGRTSSSIADRWGPAY